MVVFASLLVATSAGNIQDEACVKTPDGTVVCGESVLKQPGFPQDFDDKDIDPEERKSGYTRKQLEFSEWGARDTKMVYKQLGNTGLRVSALSLGTWVTFSLQVGEELARELVETAYNAGINFFDTAEAYVSGEAETILGNVIQWGIRNEKWRRSDLVISTKVFWNRGRDGKIESVNDIGLSRKHITEGVRGSLRRLQLDYADIVFAHRFDTRTPVEEVVRAFNFLLDQGVILYWGTSEWTATQIAEAHAVADRLGMVGPCAEQPSYSMLTRDRMEREYLPLFGSNRKLGTTIYSPLESGVLTGKYNNDIPENSRFTVNQYAYIKERYVTSGQFGSWEDLIVTVKGLQGIAESIGLTPAQLCIAWCLKNENVTTVLLGASKVEQLQENIKALGALPLLTPSLMEDIEDVLDNIPESKDPDFVNLGLKNFVVV